MATLQTSIAEKQKGDNVMSNNINVDPYKDLTNKDKLKEIGEEIVAESLPPYKHWNVAVRANPVVVKILYSKAKNLWRRRGNFPFTLEEFQSYLDTLFSLRVKQVDGEYISKQVRHFLMPTDVAITLTQIGIAEDKDYRKVLKPVLSPDVVSEKLLDLDKMAEISTHLASLRDWGYTMVSGLPESIYGSLFMMALTFQKETLVSYSKLDPGFGMFAYLAEICNMSMTFSTDSVIFYGFKTSFELAARSLYY